MKSRTEEGKNFVNLSRYLKTKWHINETEMLSDSINYKQKIFYFQMVLPALLYGPYVSIWQKLWYNMSINSDLFDVFMYEIYTQ